MAQVTRDIIQLKKSKTGDVFYPETHMQAVIGLNGNKDAKTVLAGPISGSAGPASFRPLYPTDIIPLFTKEYTYKCTANDTNNGNIYFMNVTPTSNDWATPWSVHYTLQVDCLTSEDANSKYCHGFYDIYVGSAGSNYYYHVFNTFYSSSYYPVYYHKLLYHNTEAKYTNYHITNPVKLGARIQSAWGANTRTRIYNIKVYDYKNCTISFPENIEIYGDVYRDTYYNTIDWNATSTGLQETSDQNDTTTMNLYYTRLQAGTNGIKQYSLVMQDKNGKWQSFTKGAGGTATTKEKNDAEFRLGSRIYRMGRSSDLGADGYLSNGQVQAYCGLIDLRYSLNIVSNNSATGGSVGLTQYKPVYIVGTINSNGYFVLDDVWWTQDEPITEDGKIYIRVVDSVYLDNTNNPDGQYRGDLISDGYAYYYKNGSFQRYVIADSANIVPWSGVTGRPSFYDLVIKASDATTLLTYKPTTSGTYQLQLSASQIGLGNVENTKLSTWAGTSNITTLGTISTGTWHGSTIDVGYGGTGKTSWTQYGVLYADTTSSLSQVVNNTTSTRKFLRMVGSNNAAIAPAWDTVTKTDVGLSNVENTALSTWTGTNKITTVGTITSGTWNGSTIAIGKGGTGLTSYTKGDMLYASANNTLAKLGANTGTKRFLSMASSVPSWEAIATSDLPAMYIGKTAVKFENTTEQALTGISTGAFSSSITVGDGSAPASNEQASTTQKRRIYFGSSNYYIEVDKNGYLHTNVGFYSDSFVSAGGLSNAGGSSGIDPDALWELLAASTSEQINSSHLPKGSAADLTSGTSTTGVTWGAKTIVDYVTNQINTSISSALYFRGQSTTAITNGGTETATINGHALVAQTGDLVLYDGKEFVWDGTHWIQFGDESSWASKNITISTSGYLTGGGDLTTNRTISINSNKISDSSVASSLSSTSTNLVTERDIYYGLPTINNSHAYTSSTSIYAPTSAGTANQVLLSGGANTAPTWGNASGLSVGTASKLGSSTVGSTTKPIYLSSGTATECNTYAGGTAVTLNGTSKAANTASFYAPTGGGTANQVLIAGGNNTAPSWTNQNSLSVGTASKLGSTTVGNVQTPIYLNAGTPTAVSSVVTSMLVEPSRISISPTTMPLVPTTSGNKLALIPAEQIIVESTTDGGTTWVSAGISDDVKRRIFHGIDYDAGIAIPIIDGVRSPLCGIRITITAMRYNVPSGTSETEKYNYWNSTYVASAERYCSLTGIYLWVNSLNDTIKLRVYGAKGSDSNTWTSMDSGQDALISGWSGGNYVKLNGYLFGGGTSQTANYWNYRLVFFTNAAGTGTYASTKQSISGISGFGESAWRIPNNLVRWGNIYTYDVNKNTTFPGSIYPNSNNSGNLGTSSTRWSTVFATTLDAAGNTTIGGTLTVGTSSANKATTLNGTLNATGNTTIGGTLGVTGATTLSGGASIKGTGNAITNINGATANVDYAHIFVTGNNNNTHPLVLQNGYGNVGIGVTQPSYKLAVGGTFNVTGASTLSSTLAVTGLATLSGGISLGTQYTPSGSSTAVDSRLVWDNTNKAWHLIGNFYADGFVSAGGMSNASGSGGVDLSVVWASLTNDPSDEYINTKIHTNHLPTIEISGTNVTSGSGTYTYTSASSAKLALTINVKDTTYSVVSSSANGLAPKTGSDASATIATQSTEWVLTTTSGGTPTWRKLPSAAFSTGTDVNVKVNNTNPTSGTWYYPTWYTATSGTGNVNANDGLQYYSLQGTTSADGRAIINIGNSTASGTAGNKYGELRIYSKQTYYGQLSTATLTANRTYTLPDATGTVVLLDASQALTNKTYNGYTLAAACAKAVVASIDTSASLPTSNAVKTFVEGKGYVLTGTAQTITAKHTFSNGFVLSTASSWTNSDRSIPFSVDSDDSNIRYYYTDSTKGLTYNPNTGAVKAAKFISRSGGSGFLKADGTEDTTNYLKGTSNSNVAIRATDSSNTWGAVGFAEGDNTKYNLYSIRFGATPGASYGGSSLAYGSGMMFGGADTRGFIAVKYNSGHVEFGGGSVSAPTINVGWHFGIDGADGVSYNLATIASNASNGNTAYNSLENYLLKSGGAMTGELYLKYANPRVIFQAADGTVHGNIAVRSAGVLEFYDLTAYRTVYHSGNFTPGNYVLKSGDTMSGDLIIEKTGGSLTIRGASNNANANGGYIYLAGRYSGGERNGCKIAAVYPGSGAYDIQDLVFYSSNNRSGDASPVWEEAMRIKADKAISMNGSLSISRGGVYNIYTNNTASDGTATGIRFQLNGTTKGGLFVSSDENLYYSVGTASTGNKVLTSANYDSFALPLSAGSSYPLTGHLYLNEGLGIQAVGGVGLLVYHPTSGWSGIDSTQWGLGSINSQGVIRSNNNDLLHYKGSSSYSIWDASNSNLSTVDWAANNLTVAGTSTFSDTMYVENRKYMQWKDSGGTYRNVFGLNNADNLLIGYSLSSVTGSATTIYGEAVRLQATDVNEIIKTGGATLVMRGTQLNNQVHTILFRGSDTDSNGFKIQTTAAGSFGRQSLGFYRSNVTSGSSPYTPVWKRSLYMPYDGGVVVGTSSSDTCDLTVYGDITTSNNVAIDNTATRTLNFLVRTGNVGAGNIFFQANYNGTAGYNGFKISSVQAAYASRQDLVFYRSNNITSPYTFTPTEILRLTYDGHVKVTGDIQSTGDQVVSSDACLKENFGRINYSVSDIAACRAITFDWKDGRGRSAGSIAQDWKPLIPELVHGEDGNMTLAYGQIALINSIIIARHEKEQDKKIEELENKIVALENEIDLLRNGIR